MRGRRFACVAALWSAGLAIAAARPADPVVPYEWHLPANFPRPRVPADNPMSEAKAELGRHLFYDTRLSENGTQSCSTCHEQARAFTEGKGRAVGSTGQVHPRGAMSLVNVAYAGSLTWVYQGVTQLETQALVPMFGDQPIELGLPKPGTTLLTRLRAEPRYRPLFERAFGASPDPFSIEHVAQALASFERTIISASSAYDRYHNDRDPSAISPAARRGELIYFAQPFACFRCHGGPAFSGAFDYEGRRTGEGPPPEDRGAFKAPTLRNIAVTAPYLHDGSAATLEEAVAHDAPNRGYRFEPAQRDDLVAFLRALTDESLLHDRRWSNPWITESSEY